MIGSFGKNVEALRARTRKIFRWAVIIIAAVVSVPCVCIGVLAVIFNQ